MSDEDTQQGVINEAPPTSTQPNADNQEQQPVKTEQPNAIPYPRFHQLIEEKNEFKKQVQDLQNQVQQLQSTPVQKEPNQDDFDTDEGYVAAKIEYQTERLLEQKLQQFNERQQREAENRNYQQQRQSFGQRVSQYAEKNPGFDKAMMENPNFQLNDTISRAVVQVKDQDANGVDVGAKLYHHLASNPAITYHLNTLPPTQATFELGQIVSNLKGPSAPPATTSAPPPMTPVTGGAVTNRDDPADAESIDEYVAMRMKKLSGR